MKVILMSRKEFRVLAKMCIHRKRLHSSLGYRPPEEYERLLTEDSFQEGVMA